MQHKQLVRQQHRDARARRVGTGWLIYIPPNRTLGMADTAAAAWRTAAERLVKPRSTVRSIVDHAIDWHEKNNKPCRGIAVNATPNTIRKFARRKRGKFIYRGQVILPLRKSRTRAEIEAEKIAHSEC